MWGSKMTKSTTNSLWIKWSTNTRVFVLRAQQVLFRRGTTTPVTRAGAKYSSLPSSFQHFHWLLWAALWFSTTNFKSIRIRWWGGLVLRRQYSTTISAKKLFFTHTCSSNSWRGHSNCFWCPANLELIWKSFKWHTQPWNPTSSAIESSASCS